MRVLHVIDPQSPDGGPCTLRLLADVVRRLEAQQQTLVIGGRDEVDLAVRCGVDVAGSLCPPRAVPWAGVASLRQAVRSLERRCGSHDLVHAWTARSGALALNAFPARTCITSLHAGPEFGLTAWQSVRTLHRRRGHILAASTAIRKQLRARGIGNDRLTLIPPGVAPQGDAAEREAVRAMLSERSDSPITPQTLIVGLLGEPASSADANVAATIAARVALSGRPIRMLVHPHAADRMSAELMMHHLGFDELMMIDELIGEPWKIAGGLDAALLVQRRHARGVASSVLPLLHAIMSGTPVVAEASDSLRDVLEDGAGCMVVKQGEVNAAAQCLVRLFDDLQYRERLIEQGRSFAADMLDIDAYAVRLRHSYDLLLANRTVRTTSDPTAMADVSAEAAMA